MSETPDPKLSCPDPLARAPRVENGVRLPHQRLYLAPPALRGAMVALISRDTCGLDLSGPQRLTHFPASPLICLSWFHGMEVGTVERRPNGPAWSPFGAPVVLSGSQSRPLASWAPTTGRGYMACFPADVAQSLFDIDLAAIHDRFIPIQQLTDTRWELLGEALLSASDDAATLSVLEEHLGKRWQALQGPMSPLASLRQAGRHWVQRLAWQAHEWRRTHSPRQVERRIKSFSGRSLREWHSLTKTEGLFFAARDRYEKGDELDWASLAADQNFADQAHLSRATKRITGFSPVEFTRRFIEDESFWLYRLWG